MLRSGESRIKQVKAISLLQQLVFIKSILNEIELAPATRDFI